MFSVSYKNWQQAERDHTRCGKTSLTVSRTSLKITIHFYSFYTLSNDCSSSQVGWLRLNSIISILYYFEALRLLPLSRASSALAFAFAVAIEFTKVVLFRCAKCKTIERNQFRSHRDTVREVHRNSLSWQSKYTTGTAYTWW